MPQLQNVEWSGVKTLSQETVEKGEAFILALIQEGHTYNSMKGAFIKCVLRTWLRLTKGVVAQTAEKMKTNRNWIFNTLKKCGLRDELAAIRAIENGAGK